MIDKDIIFDKVDVLDDLAMEYEVAVIPFFENDYLSEFFDFYKIKDRGMKLIPSETGFDESLKDLNGEYRWEAISEKTKSLFGLPARVMVFDDNAVLNEKLGGRSGLSPFFFVFDLMFCEYKGYTLCFISGSNN